MRENTFYPLLCLVQLGNEEEAAAVDPMAEGIDLAPMLELFCNNEDVLKVFHAGGQDVEIIYNLTGKTPHPIFDTQIAMMAISQSEQIGYANLVESWLGKTIDKGARFTDWSRRPLTERQIEYAIGDVTYLAKIFPKILKKLIKTGRGEWLNAEMEKLADPANYANDLETAWHRIRAPSRNAVVLGRLKALAAWRETEAQDKDIPRGRIMRDETLADLASQPPKKQEELAKVRGLSQAWRENDIGRRLMRVLASAEPLPERRDARQAQARRAAGQGRRAGRRPAQAAAQDPHPRDRRRRPPADPLRRARGACRRGAQPAGARRVALRDLRPRRARAGRGQARLRGRERAPEDDPHRPRDPGRGRAHASIRRPRRTRKKTRSTWSTMAARTTGRRTA